MKNYCRVFVATVVCASGLFIGNWAEAVPIWAMDTDVSFPVLGVLADHTYACVGSYSDCYTFPAGTTKTGGTVNQVGSVSSATAEFAKIHAECCRDAMIYLIDGVCHQHSNQVLQYAGLELAGYGVDGYSITRWYYGPRGNCIC